MAPVNVPPRNSCWERARSAASWKLVSIRAGIVGHPVARVSPSNVRAGSRGSCGDRGTCADRTPEATTPLRQSCRIEAGLGSTGAGTVLAGFTLGLAQRLGLTAPDVTGSEQPCIGPTGRGGQMRTEATNQQPVRLDRSGLGAGRSQSNSWLPIVRVRRSGRPLSCPRVGRGLRPAVIPIGQASGAVSGAGYPVGTGGVEMCRSLRPAAAARCAAAQRFSRLEAASSDARTAMVRKGSPVRVRQRASETVLRRGSLVLGVDRVTTSLMDRGSPVQASVATSSGERGFAARAAVVLDAIIRHGGPAGY